MTVPLALRGRTGVVAGGLLLALLALVLVPRLAPGAQSSSALRGEIDRQSRRESQLQGTAAKLGAMEDAATKAASVAQGRLADVQAQYDAAQGRLATTSAELRTTRARLVRLHRNLAQGRSVLAHVLRTRYVADPPDVVDVVLSSDGFANLLERVNFLKRVQSHDTRIVTAVRRARATAARDEARLATLRRGQQRQAEAAARQRDAMASMAAGLERRRAAVAQAHAARVAALSDARTKRAAAEKTLDRLQREQERAARQFTAPAAAPGQATSRTAAPTGRWAIPWPIVQCESGGQNVGPNSMGASGYYQFMVATWKGLGGSTPQAYQASKAEQDRLAAKLWAGGAGAGNWDCAAIVGITG